jgi:hypothetical protein
MSADHGTDPTGDELTQARTALGRGGRTPQPVEVEVLAAALAAARLAAEGRIGDRDLRAAHDALVAGPVRYTIATLPTTLAEHLLARGVVPGADEHEGSWWLWWPKQGRGPCQRCGQQRSLTRYSNLFGRPYRYLCARCRRDERAEDTAELDEVTGITRRPGESADALLMRRLAALAEQAEHTLGEQERVEPGHEPGEPGPGGASASAAGTGHGDSPSDEEWGNHVDRLIDLLGSLAWAGWAVPDRYDGEFDDTVGACLYGRLHRTWMAFTVEYLPERGELRLEPHDPDELGDEPEFSMLDHSVTIDLSGDDARDAETVAAVAGEHGLLDATHLHDSDTGEEHADAFGQLMDAAYVQWLIEPAAVDRDLSPQAMAEQLDADPFFTTVFRFVVRFAGRGILPDLVPDAAALGVAAWCWRNNTAVEDWHLPGDVLMARVNIAVTKAVQPHIDPYEGVDWDAVHAALTDPTWQLPDGRVVADLFGEGWPEVARTVGEQVRAWQRLDEDVIGPQATLRLLTIGGSTSYTRHWWGQGRWQAICRRIIDDATTAGLVLPPPYDTDGTNGAAGLLDDLREPDQVSDEILDWLIDMPFGGVDGPRGLRSHPHATTPIQRTIAGSG